MQGPVMPQHKFPAPPLGQTARPLRRENVSLFFPAESAGVELAVGQPNHPESLRRNCTENDERSLNVIENTGCRWGISWNVIDKIGG
jgi:hypothetical protein